MPTAVSLAKRLGEELRETRGKLAGAEQELGHLRQVSLLLLSCTLKVILKIRHLCAKSLI